MPFSLLFSPRNSPFLPISDHSPLTILMDSPEFPTGKSPRRELQGPRPTPLKVRKDSHKIRKPPVAPAAQPPIQPSQPRQPVIIYTVSPKIIHADPSEFMNLVQRLTGSSSSSMVAAPSFTQFHETGAISPAARFASTEKTKLSPEKQRSHHHLMNEELGMFDQGLLERTGTLFPGILSPGPASLPPIPQKMFQSPAAAAATADLNPFNTMFNDFSPMLGGSNSFMIPSPSNYFLSPKFASPTTTTPSMDIFNNFFDF